MKRKLSLLLAVVMILGSFSFAFANEDVKPAEFLEDKGVLLGNDSGDLMLEEALERRDAVVMLSRLLGVEKEAQAFEEEGLPTWEDNNDAYYNGFLAWAQSNEYFEGHSEEKFGPRDNITVREYAVVLLRALGYKEEAAEWKEVFDTAKKLGLLEGIDKEADDEVLRGEMAEMTFIALGTAMKGSEKTLAEELGIEMPAAKELKAVVNDTENLKEVVVELSNAKLADEEKLVDKDNYRVDKFKVERVTVDGDNVIVELDKAMVKGRSYDLTIRNIDKAINAKYSFKAQDNASPEVVNVEVLGEYGIKVTVSEPVEEPKERDFLVDGKNIAMNLETYGRDIILTPYHKSAFSANAETLTVKSLEDFAGYKASLEDFEIEIVKDDEAPEVVDVVLKGNAVEVTFDKDIYEDSVEGYVNRRDVGNISYKSGRHDIYTLEEEDDINYGTKIDTNKARYVFEEEPSKRTEFTIEGVQNHSKVTMDKVTLEAREVKDDQEPEIIDVDVDTHDVEGTGKSWAEITLEFDKNIKDETDKDGKFDAKDYFDLYEQEVASRYKITDDKDVKIEAKYDNKDDKDIKDTIVVTIEGLNINDKREYDYILEVRNFRSESGGSKMYRDYVDFEIKEGKDLIIESITPDYDAKKDETEIVIVFNRGVDRRRAEDETNYLFRKTVNGTPKDVADLDGEITVDRDGKRVTIEIPEFDFNDRPIFEVLEALRDKDNNKLKGKREHDLRGKFEDAAAVENVKALIDNLPADDKVTVDDEKQIEAARKAFDALTKAQKDLIGAEDLEELKEALEAVEGKLEDVKEAAGDKAKDEEVATLAVRSAELAQLDEAQAKVTAAKTLVDALDDGEVKDDLQARLDAVQDKIDVAAAKEALKLTVTDATEAKATITLPAKEDKVDVTWEPAGTEGKYTTPDRTAEVQEITLTATLKKGKAEETKTFTVTIPAGAEGNEAITVK